MMKLIKSHNEYHLLDTEAPIKAMEDLCYNSVSLTGGYSGLYFRTADLSESKPFSANKKTNLFKGIHKAIATTSYDNQLQDLIHINKGQIEELISVEKCGKCGGSDNEYHRNENNHKWLCCSCYISRNCSETPQTLWAKGEKKEFTLTEIKKSFGKGFEFAEKHLLGYCLSQSYEDEFNGMITGIKETQMECMEWEAEIKIIDIKPDESGQLQFAPYKSIQFIKLTPIKY